MKSILLLLVRAYQLGISPYLGQNCRFYPTCSNYAREAIGTHGALAGSALAAKRLCKCHPWHAGGVDPVPAVADSRINADSRTVSRTAASATTEPSDVSTLVDLADSPSAAVRGCGPS